MNQETGGTSAGTYEIVNLRTNALEDPLGIDALHELSWNMVSNVIGAQQSAYRILLATDDAFKNTVWDSGIVQSGLSVGIVYSGPDLNRETDYWWKVIVTNQDGQNIESAAAHFATGLADGLDRSVWHGAQFIGSTDTVFRSAYMHVGYAQIDFTIDEGDDFSFVFGADDFRFAEPAMNPFNTPGGENFNRIEINTADITKDSNPGARFAIYRVGYDQTDTMNGDPNVYAYKWGRLDPSVITYGNKNTAHMLSVSMDNSSLTIQVDGTDLPTTSYGGEIAITREQIGTPIAEEIEKPAGLEDANILRRPGAPVARVLTMTGLEPPPAVPSFDSNITPNITYPEDRTERMDLNAGGNHNTYPNMNSIGFQVNKQGDKVTISRLVINERNNPSSRIVFGPKQGATYGIFDGAPGVEVTDSTITVTGTAENAGRPIYADPSSGSMTYLRTEFTADKNIADAKLYITAFGGYEAYINGQRVGEDWFTPGLTQYREYLNYNTYDVTKLLQKGDNAFGAMVGVGFYAGNMANTLYNVWTDHLAAMAMLHIEYADGCSEYVVTNPYTWKVCTCGPVVYTDIYDGYMYDAANEKNVEGWTRPGFRDPNNCWHTPEVITSNHPKDEGYTFDKVQIISRTDNPVRIANTRTAVRMLETHFANGENGITYTYDMGTALTGIPSITIPAGSLKEGDRVVVRYAESIYPGNSDARDFEGNEIEYHNTLGQPDYRYEELYGEKGGYRTKAAGKLLWDTNRAAMDTDIYIASKEDETRDVVFEPGNTFHGHRYLMISIPNRKEPLPLENIRDLELSSIAKPINYLTGSTTDISDKYPSGKTAAMHMQFFRNTLQSQFGNFISIPTDCPQRNERQGWTGDLQLYSRTATYHSLQTQNFLRQWMDSVTADLGENGGMGMTSPEYMFTKPNGDDLSIVWGGAIVQAPWQLYRQYGDKQVIANNYAFIKRYIDNESRGYTPADSAYPLLTTVDGLADHIGLDRNTAAGNGSCMLQNVLLIHLVHAAAVMAQEMGDKEYAQSLERRAEIMTDSWNRCFVDPETGMTLDRNPQTGELSLKEYNGVKNAYIDTQSTYAYPLYYDVVSNTMTITAGPNAGMSYRDFFAKRLSELAADPMLSGDGKGPMPNPIFLLASGGPYTASGRPYTITTGFAATPSLLPALTLTGSNEAAYTMFSNTDYATWLYPVKLGATTQWELWDTYDRALMWAAQSGMNSFNHFALGSSVEWVYEYMIGITSGEKAGYKHFVLQPSPGGTYTSVEGGYESNYGMISVAWTAEGNGSVDKAGQTAHANDLLSYEAHIPANTSATLYLPVDTANVQMHTDGAQYKGITEHNGRKCAQFELTSGAYVFTADNGSVTVRAGEGYVQPEKRTDE